MSTKKVNGTLIGDHEVIGSVDNVWIDTSNPNKILTKVFVNGTWKTIADSAAASEAIAAVEAELANKTNKVSEATDGNLAALDSSGDLTDSGKSISDFMNAATNTGSDGQILEFTSSGPQWADAPEGTVVVDSAMSDSSTNAVQNNVIKSYVDAADNLKADKTTLDNYALKTGSYDTLTAGMAKNIEGQSTIEGTYLERPTAYPTDVATGVAPVEQIKGHSVVWNQLRTYRNSTTVKDIIITNNTTKMSISGTADSSGNVPLTNNFSVVKDHKYCVYVHVNTVGNKLICVNYGAWLASNASASSYIVTSNHSTNVEALGISITSGNTYTGDIAFDIFDLTLIFGVGNEPATVEAFESWLEQNVGLKPYYAYDAGSILNNKLTGFKTIGRNLLNPTTKTARLLSYEYGDNDNKFCVKNLPTGATLSFTPDATGVAASVTPDSNGIFTISGTGTSTVTTDSSLADTYLCMVWDGTMNDEPVAYEDHTYDFDVTKIYGQLNGAGDYVQVYPNGMIQTNKTYDVKDVLTKDVAYCNAVNIDLGSLTWTKNSSTKTYYYASVSNIKGVSSWSGSIPNAICAKYTVGTPNQAVGIGDDVPDSISIRNNTIYVYPSATYVDGAAFKTANSGIYINCEYNTPLVYTNLVYRDNGVDTPLSEIFPINILVDNWSTEQALVTAYSSDAPTSCAPVVETLFGLDVANWIDSANNGTFISADSMDALLSALGTAMGGTWSKSWDSTNGKWGFTFTPSSNFLATGVEASGTWGVDETTKALTLTPDEE